MGLYCRLQQLQQEPVYQRAPTYTHSHKEKPSLPTRADLRGHRRPGAHFRLYHFWVHFLVAGCHFFVKISLPLGPFFGRHFLVFAMYVVACHPAPAMYGNGTKGRLIPKGNGRSAVTAVTSDPLHTTTSRRACGYLDHKSGGLKHMRVEDTNIEQLSLKTANATSRPANECKVKGLYLNIVRVWYGSRAAPSGLARMIEWVKLDVGHMQGYSHYFERYQRRNATYFGWSSTQRCA
jgi:hypothetical protein